MDSSTIIELVGYTGSALVLVSMLMTSVIKLRIWNLTGCVIFSIYAFIIKSYPTAIMNVILVFINIYNLIKLNTKNTDYDVVECGADDSSLYYFVKLYDSDIKKYLPELDKIKDKGNTHFMVFHQGKTVGILMGNNMGNNQLKINADYTIPSHRDCSVGLFLQDYLKKNGFRELICDGTQTEAHSKYLQKLGFKKEGEDFVKRF